MSIVTNEVPEIVGLILSNYGVAPSNLFTESSPILWRLVFPPEPFKLTPDCFGLLPRLSPGEAMICKKHNIYNFK